VRCNFISKSCRYPLFYLVTNITSPGDKHGWFKDSTNSIISTGVTTAKDGLQQLSETLANQHALEELAGTWVDNMRDTLENQLINLQKGDDNSVAALNTTFYGGVWAQTPDPSDATLESMRDASVRILISQMLIPAWSLVADAPGKGGITPVIVMQDGACNKENPFDNQQPDGLVNAPIKRDLPHNWAMEDHDADISRVCLDGEDKTYYLIASGYGDLTEHLTHALPGIEELHVNGKYGGIAKEDIVFSSVSGYHLNGDKNGYQMPEDSMIIDGSGRLGEYIFQEDIRTPGYWTVPICTANELVGGILKVDPKKDDCAGHWPCCGVNYS
jgi:hypothetical protein